MTEIHAKNIEITPIEKIVPNPKNRNQHPESQIEMLCKIIKHQGFREPLIISKRSGFLVAGHGRLEAAKKLGIEKLPVIRQDFASEALEYQHMIADNEIARWASLDVQGLREDLKDFDLDELEIDMLGVNGFEIDNLKLDIDTINQSDEQAAWASMDECFEPGEDYIKLVIHFSSEESRTTYCEKNKIDIKTKSKAAWIAQA